MECEFEWFVLGNVCVRVCGVHQNLLFTTKLRKTTPKSHFAHSNGTQTHTQNPHEIASEKTLQKRDKKVGFDSLPKGLEPGAHEIFVFMRF